MPVPLLSDLHQPLLQPLSEQAATVLQTVTNSWLQRRGHLAPPGMHLLPAILSYLQQYYTHTQGAACVCRFLDKAAEAGLSGLFLSAGL